VRRAIRQVRLRPEAAQAAPEAVRALEAADLVAIGPGSLYTSLIPVLLVRELAQALARSRARSPRHESDVRARGDGRLWRRRLPHGDPAPRAGGPIHDVLLNTAPFPRDSLARYAAKVLSRSAWTSKRSMRWAADR